MDPSVADGGVQEQTETFTDIQSYLANFNKEINDGNQAVNAGGFQILQDGELSSLITDSAGGATLTVVQAEDGTTQLVMTAPPSQADMKQENSLEGGEVRGHKVKVRDT